MYNCAAFALSSATAQPAEHVTFALGQQNLVAAPATDDGTLVHAAPIGSAIRCKPTHSAQDGQHDQAHVSEAAGERLPDKHKGEA